MKEILLIRHGATAGNLGRRYIGRTDESLCEVGVAQIKALQERRLEAQHLFASPMRRTRETAELLFPGRPYAVLEGLRETDFGIFEGKTASELSGCPAYQSWVDSACSGEIPRGESREAVSKRAAAAFLQAVGGIKEEESVAFVTHGGVIMSLLERFGAERADYYTYHVKNGGFFRCMWDGTWLHILEKG